MTEEVIIGQAREIDRTREQDGIIILKDCIITVDNEVFPIKEIEINLKGK